MGGRYVSGLWKLCAAPLATCRKIPICLATRWAKISHLDCRNTTPSECAKLRKLQAFKETSKISPKNTRLSLGSAESRCLADKNNGLRSPALWYGIPEY